MTKLPLTKEEFLDRLEKREDYLYRVGVLATRNNDYLEWANEYINEHLTDDNNLDGIVQITRKSSYKVKHSSTSNGNTNRREERFVLCLFENKEKDSVKDIFGELIDYQVPLKNNQSDKGVGKIDFLFKKDNALYFAEIKAETNNESILKAIIELQAYYQLANKEKLLKDFKDEIKDNNLPIKKCVVIFDKSVQAKQLDNHIIKNLLKKFGIKVIVLKISIEQLEL